MKPPNGTDAGRRNPPPATPHELAGRHRLHQSRVKVRSRVPPDMTARFLNLPRSADFSPQEAAPIKGRPGGLKPALRNGSWPSRMALGPRRRFPNLVLCGGTALLLARSAASEPTRATADPDSAPRAPSVLDSSATAPPFSVGVRDGAWWLFTPGGLRFFSRGVCVVTPGLPREAYDVENPAYAAWHHYPDNRTWAEATSRRLNSWRFTTLGAWSDLASLRPAGDTNLFLTPVLHMGSTAGAPWWDMWDPEVIGRIDSTARQTILDVRDDPRLIGYYSDNELGWWNATLFKMTLEQRPGSGQRQRLLQLLRQTYDGDWQRLLADFTVEGADSWAELDERGMLYMRPGGRGVRVMRRFLGLVAERYYSLVREIIRRYDRRALILGDRYQSFFYPEVASAAAPYVDAISSNLNAPWNDGTFPRGYLDCLHHLTGKPILVSEIYMAARNNRSGNRNDSGVFPVVETQRQRAASLRRSLEFLLGVPTVIGLDWFQYFDEPTHGRDDGENFNFGLVDIHDRPYPEVVQVFRDLEVSPDTRPRRARCDAREGLPPAPRRPLDHFQPLLALKHWDRERGYVPPADTPGQADLYGCWSPNALYLGLFALDIVEDAYYRDRRVPKEDRAQWIVELPGRRDTIRARIGAGRDALVNEPRVRVESLSGLNLNVRCFAAMQIPASLWGKRSFRPGDEIELAVTLHTHAQAYRIRWTGNYRLRR